MAACLVQTMKGFREKTGPDVSKEGIADNWSTKWGETLKVNDMTFYELQHYR